MIVVIGWPAARAWLPPVRARWRQSSVAGDQKAKPAPRLRTSTGPTPSL